MQQKRKMTPFFTYMISDIVLVVLVVLTMVPYISNTLTQLDRRAEETLRINTAGTLESLDALITNVESIVMNSRDESLSVMYRLGSEKKKASAYYSMHKASEYLYTIVTANPTISDLLVNFPSTGITLRAGSCFDSPEVFKLYYQSAGFYEELFLATEHSRFVPSRRLNYSGWQSSEEVFGYRFDLDRFGRAKACLLINTSAYINAKLLNSIGEGGYVSLADHSGNILFQSGDAAAYALSSRYFTIQSRSPSGLLTLTVHSKRMLPSAALPSLISLLLLCLVAAFTVGALYSVLSARRHAMPVKRLVAELGQYHTEIQVNQTRLNAMQNLMEDLKQENEQFMIQLSEFRQTRYENALTRLFSTSSTLSTEDKSILSQVSSVLPSRYFVAYGRMEQLEENSQYQEEMSLLLRSMLRQQLPANCPVYMPDFRSVAILMEESMLAERDAITAAFPDISWSFSRSYHGDRFVATALEEARILHEFKGRKAAPLSLQSFQRIYNSMIAGDDAEADLQLDELFASANNENIRFIYGGMRLILYLVASECGISVLAPPFDRAQSFESLCAVLRQAAHAQCAEIDARKKSRNEDRKKRVLQYIQENYADSALYAPAIAERVGISEKYLYNFVKEQTGFSLGEYLMHLRMTKAAELLVEQDMPIKEICYAVGFNSENSFYKAFKRTYGITPTQYRSAQKKTVVDI